jgi:hypothetical protein
MLATAQGGEQVYSWTDADGAAHYTNDAATIPLKYRDKARTLDGQPVSSPEAPRPAPAADGKQPPFEETPKAPPPKPPAEPLGTQEEESAPPPLSPSAAETLDEPGWRKRFIRSTERVRRAELALRRDREQLSRVSNEEGYMVVDAYGRTMTAGRSTALKMQVAEDERLLSEARESLQDLERAAAREAIPFEWRH